MAVDYVAAMQRRLGLIDALGSDATNRSNAAAQSAVARRSSFAPTVGGATGGLATAPTIKSSGGSGVGDRAALYAFGDEAKRLGFRVGENSRYNGGKRVTGGHSNNSQHYSDDAVDINWAAGTSRAEQDKIRELLPLAAKYGLDNIFMAPGHYGHGHFSTKRSR